ncbi:MAG: glycogen phosphorylase [Candidatus Raymondbacteria bacterium RifOxyC12_full_50_8]|uniref:Alpha-1,4 glucan phosphorylase n=1 Tax=Candidatus Raymondbacteria bacterium RIFOXYD12_FULL_49_13 TaxID=1817890 RepID=A0A1F7F6B6_UNCRA|nr:MAG: glycogen phosphorylase [Candidatus Raymondbacteria bacterium RIFOXYA2_FULL_49_16]OGJ99642.1 MAG: glycogen phosphorylase [Candidatus Raymondbacteria bacterium RifOxyB12_full_50_8]OGK02133.1 MAG: glycogen phosphorylase [Candidatus Raymondbacteria bacterium RIFOXYD12_FULL_49_13]OGK06860.1 MAG: glycogen phosphorylase [Candidatus Raymondbacteria bacterium RifOxyC12_full_50_8]OGP42518.1 MAG: glycogen phosphorylase [Candidatus Raymondbacteria bacterium RIFOXYB2_FULL_49_35]
MKKKSASWEIIHKGMDSRSISLSLLNHMEYSLAKDQHTAQARDFFYSVALSAQDRLIERWIRTQQTYYNKDVKRLYYLSLEFLMGRTLGNALYNMGIFATAKTMLEQLGYDLDELREEEVDSGLGNGGLGRLAACYLDSMATLQLPGYGYGIRYEYGLFHQKIENGYQKEAPDQWIGEGNPWEIPRPNTLYPVRFYGRVEHMRDDKGKEIARWVDTQVILAMPYDVCIPGFCNNTVNTLRLWSARSSNEFDFQYFNSGEYFKAYESRVLSESLSKILYPRDDLRGGKELRLKQEYFFVAASIQDIIRRHKKKHSSLKNFADKVAMQLNDTHPAIAIPELMRVLIDDEGLPWDKAWDITVKVFAYTNHTLMSEALERWSVGLLGYLLPRHLELIYQINERFLSAIAVRFPGHTGRLERMSLVQEGENKQIRMANLAIVGSHAVNGVAELHTELLKTRTFSDFNEYFPKKFQNITNGITQRRWLLKCNPGLADMISGKIGAGWITDLDALQKLASSAGDKKLQDAWKKQKKANKQRLAEYVKESLGITLDPASIFDCQAKRFHEYKRQHLNILHVISLYARLKTGALTDLVPRTFIYSGKAAPSYYMAKLIIKLINNVAAVVNNDRQTSDLLKVVFLPNYSVSLAEKIIPAVDVSEQISTAGTEASGTGNMKFALNGALTIGTLDGANIEIREEVGEENIFIFGLKAEDVKALGAKGYWPRGYYDQCAELRLAIDSISSGIFSQNEGDIFRSLIDSLLNQDPYMVLADFESYMKCQETVAQAYASAETWWRKSILNVANMGKFSSDRAIRQYARDIWGIAPVKIPQM